MHLDQEFPFIRELAHPSWVPPEILEAALKTALPGQILHTLELTADLDEAMEDWEYAEALHEVIASHSGVTFFPLHALDHYSLAALHGNEYPPRCVVINSLPAPRSLASVKMLQDYLVSIFPPTPEGESLKIEYTCQSAQDPHNPNSCAAFIFFNAVNYNELYRQGYPDLLQELQTRSREFGKASYLTQEGEHHDE